jgi:circadian clock protein KaiC
LGLDRVPTGINGLDDIIEGGLPRGFCYAIVGGPGTGKTTFGVQFICVGALRYNESGVYLTLEEPPYSIADGAMRFGWNIYDLEKRSVLALLDASPIQDETHPKRYVIKAGLGSDEFSVDGLLGTVNEARKRIDAKRCVVDSVSGLTLQYKDEFEARQQVLKLVKGLTQMKLTTLLLTESTEESVDVQKYGTAEFLAQGVIYLHAYRIRDSIARAIEVRKMRGVKTPEKLCPYSFTLNGIAVYPREQVFTE